MNEPNDKATAGYEFRKTIFGKVSVHYPCPKCGERLQSPLSDAGTADSCPDCGTQFEVPGADAKEPISRDDQAVSEKPTRQLAAPPAPTPLPSVTSPTVMRGSSNQVRQEAELSAPEKVRVDGDQHRDGNAALSEFMPNFNPDDWDEVLVDALRCIVAVVNQLRDRVASPDTRTFEPIPLNLHWDYLDSEVAALLAQVELAIEQLTSAIKFGIPIPSKEFVFRVDESIIDDDIVLFVRRMQEVLNGLRTRQTQSAVDSLLKHVNSNAKNIHNCVGSNKSETTEKFFYGMISLAAFLIFALLVSFITRGPFWTCFLFSVVGALWLTTGLAAIGIGLVSEERLGILARYLFVGLFPISSMFVIIGVLNIIVSITGKRVVGEAGFAISIFAASLWHVCVAALSWLTWRYLWATVDENDKNKQCENGQPTHNTEREQAHCEPRHTCQPRKTKSAEQSPEEEDRQAEELDGAQNNNGRLTDERFYASVLGLAGRITPDEVRRKYYELSMMYHPDHVSHLGVKLQETAAREMKAIDEAYGYFKKKYGM